MRRLFTLPALLLLVGALCAGDSSFIVHGTFAPQRHESVLGQDGTTPIPFDAHTTLWTFGDTILGSWKNYVSAAATFSERTSMETMLCNSLAFTGPLPHSAQEMADLHFSYLRGKDGKVQSFIPLPKGKDPRHHRNWALDGIRLGSRVYFYYLAIHVPDPGRLLEFSVEHVGLARWEVPGKWQRGDAMDITDLGKILPGGFTFGDSVIQREEWLYLAGHRKGEGVSFPAGFARVRVKDIENTEAYEFLNAHGQWQRKVAKAGDFFNDVAGELSLVWDEIDEEYRVIYCRIFKGEIMRVNFQSFNGLPGAVPRKVGRLPRLSSCDMWYYSAKEIHATEKEIFGIVIDPCRYEPVLFNIDREDSPK